VSVSSNLQARCASFHLVLTVADKSFPLCLLDTNAVSEMIKRPDGALSNFWAWALKPEPAFVPCFTIYTLMELRRHAALFEQFVETFRLLPCVLLKGYANLLEEEVANYPKGSAIDPSAVIFSPHGGDAYRLSNLPQLLDAPDNRGRERHWNESGREIVAGMLEMVRNYPAARSAYKQDEIRHFVWQASFEQLAHHVPEFVEPPVEAGEPVDVAAFPTFKAMTYTVFYKFYVDANRKPSDSDAFDVLISAALNYVEAFITEAHQAEALAKTKRHDGFLTDLQVFTLRDFR
jgi:hypothetical protein